MMVFIKLLVLFMTLSGFTQVEQWDKFNSSLVIEVTRPTGVFTCTGVAVSPKLVLTAAHCLDGEVKKVRVFTEERYDPDAGAFEVKKYKLHPLYNSKISLFIGDIAKIDLEERLPDSIQIHPINEEQKVFGKYLRIGFGKRDDQNIRTLTTPHLRKINREEQIIELMDDYSRSGDSGGPIFLEKDGTTSLVAIHSTFSHGPQGNFSLNPLLAPHLSWIFSP